jgi:hypothetical protein
MEDAETRIVYYRIGLLSAAAGLIVTGVVVHKRNIKKRQTRLFYELNDVEQAKHQGIQEALGFLSRCHYIWRVEAESATSDWKRNSGASSLVRRGPANVSTVCPPRVETSVQVPCVHMERSQLYFLPDTILYHDGQGYGAMAYEGFGVEQGFTRFIESDGVPGDASVVGHTWRYVNKNGGPDRRFNDNRQLPVLQLGVLILASSKGFNVQLNTSNPQQTVAFSECWRTAFQPIVEPPRHRAHPEPPPRRGEEPSSQTSSAKKILGVRDDATPTDISAAYHRLAQMYHPAKVAGLAPKFQILADKRMKEINAAYSVLKPKGEQS